MILSRIMPTYVQLVFEMMIFRNSIRNGTEFYCDDENPSDDILESFFKSGLGSLRKSRPYWNCMTWRFIRRNEDVIITD